MIKIKRIHEPCEPSDGYRVLVDRLWPRGQTKEGANLDEWLRDIAPSTELRRWFNHEPARWKVFAARYRAELGAEACIAHLDRLRGLARRGTVTLLYAAKDERHNNAVVIREVIGRV